MTDRSTPSDRIIIDPRFSVPDGAEDVFAYTPEGPELDIEDLDTIYIVGEINEGETEEEEEPGINAPKIMKIVSQELRRGPAGKQRVDVVIKVKPMEGHENKENVKYEIQVVKT